jgi:hypothetical protein
LAGFFFVKKRVLDVLPEAVYSGHCTKDLDGISVGCIDKVGARDRVGTEDGQFDGVIDGIGDIVGIVVGGS